MENQPTIGLIDLAPELLCLIADHTRSYTAFSAFARVNRALYQVLNPYLYLHNSRPRSGRNALLWAARHGREDTTRLALRYGRVLTSVQPLMVAAQYGHDRLVALLLPMEGVDIRAKDSRGNTALTYAVTEGHEAIVKTLLDAGALPDPASSMRAHCKELRSAFFLAIEKGHTRVVKLLLSMGRVNIKAKYTQHHTPLSIAVKAGHLEIVQTFLDLGVPVNTVHEGGHTPLTLAIRGGHPDIVKLLLASGADPNTLHHPHQSTPIFLVIDGWRNTDAILRILLDDDRVNVNHLNDRGFSPLRSVVNHSWSSNRAAMLLSRKDLDPNLGHPLSHAPMIEVRQILGDPRLTLDSKLRAIQGALGDRIMFNPRKDLFKPLFDSIRDSYDLNEPLIDGMTLLMRACLTGHEEAVDLLLNAGADPDGRAPSSSASAVEYPSPLHCAIRGAHTTIVQRLLRTQRVDVECPMGGWGWSAFLAAAAFGRVDILRLLQKEAVVDLSRTDARGMGAAALVAHCSGEISVMKELLSGGEVDLYMVDDQGKSALDYALERSNTALATFLTPLVYGFPVDISDLRAGRVKPSGQIRPVVALDSARLPRRRGRRSRNGKKRPVQVDERLWSCGGRYAMLNLVDRE